jgi:hypothetical protein
VASSFRLSISGHASEALTGVTRSIQYEESLGVKMGIINILLLLFVIDAYLLIISAYVKMSGQPISKVLPSVSFISRFCQVGYNIIDRYGLGRCKNSFGTNHDGQSCYQVLEHLEGASSLAKNHCGSEDGCFC